LAAQGLKPADATVWLRASGGRPDNALGMARLGRPAESWSGLPQAVARGDLSRLDGLSPSQAVETLQKISHDAIACRVGAQPRFFEASDMGPPASLKALSDWSSELATARRTADHPFNAGLMLEALISRAQLALKTYA
jgi:DNA polymerase-3 subunit delta'